MSLRDGPLGDIRVPLTWSAAAALVIAAIIAGALLFGDRRETMKAQAYDTARHAVDVVAAPVGGVLSAPVRWTREASDYVGGYFFAVSENRRLKAELAAAQVWRDRLEAVQLENQRYRALLGVSTDPPLPHVFARTVSDARGPFANTRLADVGADRGVTEGNPVLSERGVVGRIVGVSDHVSRILLLTDIESRTPVLIVRTNGRAILTGDGGPTPKLDYIRTPGQLKEGDRVLTSGDGGVFPRGLPVGTVVKGVGGSWRVALDSDASPIDDVQILLFKDFSQLVNEQALAPKDLPTAMTEEPRATIVTPIPPKPGAAEVGAKSDSAGAAKPKSDGADADGAKPKSASTPAQATAGSAHAKTPKHADARHGDAGHAKERIDRATCPGMSARTVNAARPLSPVRWLGVPMLMCMAATVLFATPLRVFGLALPEPVFPLSMAFAWAVIRPSILPPFALLAMGLALDFYWGGPRGLWPLCLLTAYAAVLWGRRPDHGPGLPDHVGLVRPGDGGGLRGRLPADDHGRAGRAQPAGRRLAVSGHPGPVPLSEPSDPAV